MPVLPRTVVRGATAPMTIYRKGENVEKRKGIKKRGLSNTQY